MAISERKDEVDELYRVASSVSIAAKATFIISLVCSAILLINFESVFRGVIEVIVVVSTITYVILANLHDMFFFYRAESERRKVLISNALGIDASSKETSLYYNNPEKQSVVRLGINSYESVFFTKKVVAKMLIPRSIGGLMTIALYIALLLSSSDLGIIILVTQTLFSGEILIGIIKLVFYYFKLNAVQGEFYGILIKCRASNQRGINALLLDAVIDYECLKSYCQIALSSKIFNKYNEKWSGEWKSLYRKIKKAANRP